jgi:hypothetical protein
LLQATNDFDEGYNAYTGMRKAFTEKADLIPEQIMKLIQIYEERFSEESKKKEAT